MSCNTNPLPCLNSLIGQETGLKTTTSNNSLTILMYLFFIGESGVHKLAVKHAGTLGVGGQQPDNKGDLKLKIKWKPGKMEVNI